MKNFFFFFFLATATFSQAKAQTVNFMGPAIDFSNPFERNKPEEKPKALLICQAKCMLSNYDGPGKNLGDYRTGYSREALGSAKVYYPAYYNQSPQQSVSAEIGACWDLAWQDLYANVQAAHGDEAANWCIKNLSGTWSRYKGEVYNYEF